MGKRFAGALLAGLLGLLAPPALAALEVLACEPEWGALAEELAGPHARVSVATTAFQDPHRIEARPSLLARARRADLLVCTGADLEAGWLSLLQRDSGNARIQHGRRGDFQAARHVALLESPAVLDRALGDVHAAGNPHLHLDPRNLLPVAQALAARLAALDPGNAGDYAARHRDFAARWREAIARWEQAGAGLRGLPVVEQHRNLAYLAHWLGLDVVAQLEPKPGIEPSVAHLARLVETLAERPARAVLRAAYESPRPAEWVADRTGLPVVVLPFTVGGSPAAQDLFGLFDDTLARLRAVAR